MTTIALSGLSKSFGNNFAVEDVSVTLEAGSFTALLGPSGCGKTTLLRLIAGFEQPSAGTIRFDDREIAAPRTMLPPERRDLGIVFQSYALWPHMDVRGNVAYPLKVRGIAGAELERRVGEALAMVSLAGMEDRSVDRLSGGQRQRVALARCLVTGTRIILLDEPLANLDVHLRAEMQEVFARLHRETGATIVFVTHDQAEALALADRVVVLDGGKMQQVGRPEELYAEPVNRMVAGFIGRGGLVRAQCNGNEVRIGDVAIPARGAASGEAQLLIRPEHIRLGTSGLQAIVQSSRYVGSGYEVAVALQSGETLSVTSPQRLAPGAAVQLEITDSWIVPG